MVAPFTSFPLTGLVTLSFLPPPSGATLDDDSPGTSFLTCYNPLRWSRLATWNLSPQETSLKAEIFPPQLNLVHSNPQFGFSSSVPIVLPLRAAPPKWDSLSLLPTIDCFLTFLIHSRSRSLLPERHQQRTSFPVRTSEYLPSRLVLPTSSFRRPRTPVSSVQAKRGTYPFVLEHLPLQPTYYTA